MARKERIQQLITQEITASYLEVENESHRHHVPEGSETHFKITIVSEQFIGLKPIARHRLINQLLADELKNGLHALSLHLYTPEEWQSRTETSKSPACRDGYGL